MATAIDAKVADRRRRPCDGDYDANDDDSDGLTAAQLRAETLMPVAMAMHGGDGDVDADADADAVDG
jgi:hypothetical protein